MPPRPGSLVPRFVVLRIDLPRSLFARAKHYLRLRSLDDTADCAHIIRHRAAPQGSPQAPRRRRDRGGRRRAVGGQGRYRSARRYHARRRGRRRTWTWRTSRRPHRCRRHAHHSPRAPPGPRPPHWRAVQDAHLRFEPRLLSHGRDSRCLFRCLQAQVGSRRGQEVRSRRGQEQGLRLHRGRERGRPGRRARALGLRARRQADHPQGRHQPGGEGCRDRRGLKILCTLPICLNTPSLLGHLCTLLRSCDEL